MAINLSNHTKELKILCIHGYRQNKISFREKLGALRKIPAIRDNVRLVFVNSPTKLKPVPGHGNSKHVTASNAEDQRSWWSYEANSAGLDIGFRASLGIIQQTFIAEGPFDGVMGFGQGAAFLSILCDMREKDPDGVLQFNFAIFISGYKNTTPPHACFYDVKVTIPSLHVFGDADKIIERGLSQELTELYPTGKVINHLGGHFIPATGLPKQQWIIFINDMIQLKHLKSKQSKPSMTTNLATASATNMT